MKKYLLYTLSFFFFLFGIVMSGFYAYEAFLVIGTSDYSIVFWYLPVLFIGLEQGTLDVWAKNRAL